MLAESQRDALEHRHPPVQLADEVLVAQPLPPEQEADGQGDDGDDGDDRAHGGAATRIASGAAASLHAPAAFAPPMESCTVLEEKTEPESTLSASANC